MGRPGSTSGLDPRRPLWQAPGIVRRALLALIVIAPTWAAADTVTGYDHGKKIKIQVTKVDGAVVAVRTAKAYRQMAKAAHKDGVELGIRSGYRSLAQQQHLYDAFLKGQGNSAAPPGMSNHENGTALDLKLTDPDAHKWLVKHAAKYGFAATVPGEPWHWEFVGSTATAAAKPAPVKAKKRTAHKHAEEQEEESTF